MAMIARIDQIRHNATHAPGGGPHTLTCRKCGVTIQHGDLISGSRNREQPHQVWKDETSPYYYYKLEYWHEYCNHPRGLGNTTNIPQTVTTNTNDNTWQREPAPTTNGTESNTDNDTITRIVTAIEKSLHPQLEAAFDNFENKLNTLEAKVDRNEALAADGLSTLTNRLTKIEQAQPTQVNIVDATTSATIHTHTLGAHHHKLTFVMRLYKQLNLERRNIWLAGPAGSGKTTAYRQIAEAFKVPYYFNGAIDTEYKLSGFIDANGNVINTAFRQAWTHGGMYLFDECDASLPGALLAFNGALANGHAPFPGELLPVPRHPDCYIGAAANTWGYGSDANYVGRAKLDGAFLSRFIRLEWAYDDKLERLISANDEWVDVVQAVRKIANEQGAAFIISPRDSINGADLLRDNAFTRAETVEAIFGYISRQDNETWRKIGIPAINFAK